MAKITDDELIARVDQELRLAQDYMGGKLADQRRKAMQYYLAQPIGDLSPPEVDGRSTIVSTDVADTVEWMLPSLLKIFTASDNVVQLVPRKPGFERSADDATAYLNWIFGTQNDGFRCLYTTFKDALISKCGVLKVWWEQKDDEGREEYFGLSDVELAQLLDDQEVEPVEHTARPDEDFAKQQQSAIDHVTQQLARSQSAAQSRDQQAAAMAQQLVGQLQQIQSQPSPMLHDVVVKRTKKHAQCRIEPVPPEEFFISRQAKTIKDSTFCAHVREWLVSDLRAEGYKIEDDELPKDDTGSVGWSMERAQRWSQDDSSAYNALEDPFSDPSMRSVWVVEAYFRADVDGDGIAEWRRLLKCGNKVLENVECDGAPFVAVTPVPMPHRFFGLSIADLAMEAQKQKTAAIRAILDNLYLSVNGRYYAVDGQVNLDDLLTSRPGGVVRVKNPQAVGQLSQGRADIGSCYQLLEYMETQKEARTGFTRYSQGADANSLNSTATGANIITNRADMRVELIARVFAETGVRDLFCQILELVCKYQQEPAELQLNGRWLNINPREWRHQFDVVVNVGLGTNDTVQKIAQTTQLLNIQKALVEGQTGIVSPVEIYHASEEMVKALGYKNSDRFLKDPTKSPPQEGEKGPSPEEIKAQVAIQVAQIKADQTMKVEAHKQQAQAQQVAHQNELEAQRKQLDAQNAVQIEQMRIAANERIEMMRQQTALKVAQIKAASNAGPVIDPHGEQVEGEQQEGFENGEDMTTEIAQVEQGPTMADLIAVLSLPKEIIRDENGRAVGVRTVSSIGNSGEGQQPIVHG